MKIKARMRKMAPTIPIDVNIIQTKRAVSLRFKAPNISIPERTPFEIPFMMFWLWGKETKVLLNI